MKKKLAVVFVLLTVCALSFSLSPANASIITQLNLCNEDLGIYGDFATVTVEQKDAMTIQFTVAANQDLLENGSIQKFGFNSALDTDDIEISGFSDDWSVSYTKNASEFGIFEVLEKVNGSVKQGEISFFVTSASGIELNEGMFYEANAEGHHYYAHIFDFTTLNENTSAQFSDANPVPEPMTLLLLGSGLIGLAGFRKRTHK